MEKLLQGCSSIFSHGCNRVHKRWLKHLIQSIHFERTELLCLYSLLLCHFYPCSPPFGLHLSWVCLLISISIILMKQYVINYIFKLISILNFQNILCKPQSFFFIFFYFYFYFYFFIFNFQKKKKKSFKPSITNSV